MDSINNKFDKIFSYLSDESKNNIIELNKKICEEIKKNDLKSIVKSMEEKGYSKEEIEEVVTLGGVNG